MKFHKQEHTYTPGDEAKRGSCHPTVIACLLDLELSEVPYFHLFYYTKEERENFEKIFAARYLEGKPYDECEDYQKKNFTHQVSLALNMWPLILDVFLSSRGYVEEWVTKDWYLSNPDQPYLVRGVSSRGIGHVVIYMNGELYHDPHPSNEGLAQIDPDEDYPYRILKKI